MESSLTEKALVVLVDKFNVSHHCVLITEDSSRPKKKVLLCSSLIRQTWNTVPSCGVCSIREKQTYWSKSRKESQRYLTD